MVSLPYTQILRRVVGSEYPKTFLMPSRAVGETLPPEVLEAYEAHEQLKAQQAELMARTEAEAEAKAMGKAAPGQKNSEGLTVSVLTVDTAGSPAHTPCTLFHLVLQGKPMLLAAACSPAWWRSSWVKGCGILYQP